MKLLLSLFLLLWLTPAQAQYSKADLITQVTTNFADNTAGQITPLKARTVFTNMINSWVDWLTCTTAGAISYWNGSGTPTCLSAGSTSQVLVTGTVPAWTNLGSLITGSGAVSVTATATPVVTLSAVNSGRLLANITGGLAAPTDVSWTSWMDSVCGSTAGFVPYRGASTWGCQAIAGTGTVTSVTAASGLTASPNPITTIGTVGLAAAADLSILANVSGGTAAPSANNAATVGSSLVLIQAQTASASSEIVFTSGITSTYDEYILVLTNVRPATNATSLYLRGSIDGGATYKSGGADYTYNGQTSQNGGGPVGGGGNSDHAVVTGSLVNTANYTLSGECRLHRPASTASYKQIYCKTYGFNSGSTASMFDYQSYFGYATDAMNAIQLVFSSGNIAEGGFALYGVRKQ